MPYRASPGGGGGGGSGDLVLFKWNELDTTQFGSNLITPTAGSISLGVDLTEPQDPILQMTYTGFTGRAVFPITPALVLPRRYVIRARLIHADTAAGGDGLTILIAHNDETEADFLGLEYFRSQGASSWNLNNAEGVISTGGQQGETTARVMSNSPAVNMGGTVELTLVKEASPITNPFQWLMNEHAFGPGGSIQGHGGGVVNGDDAAFTWDAAWDGSSPDNVGIGWFAPTNANTGTTEIAELEIFKHPMDY